MKTELFVDLKIPDTTAITTLRTLQRMGFDTIKELKRYVYYALDGDVYDEASTCDVLVNVNKNTCHARLDESGIRILVKNVGEDTILKKTLNGLGLPVTSVQKGVVWVLDTDKKTAEKATKELLANENYQTYEVLE